MPEAHIRGDINTPYRCIGGAIFTMQRAGFARIGFISEPPPGGRSAALSRASFRSIHDGNGSSYRPKANR